jgi:hypothetical protein
VVDDPLPQKMFRQSVTDPHQIRAGIFAGAHEITNSFDLLIGHPYRGDLTETQQLRQVRGIAGAAASTAPQLCIPSRPH